MAKKKKKNSRSKSGPDIAKKESSWPWLLILSVLMVLMAVMVLIPFLKGPSDSDTNETTVPGVTTPTVDDSNSTTMRIVQAGTAYVEKKTSAGTVFSFRRGDKVEVVEMDHEWVTIAVEGHAYYLPRNMVRGMDEYVIVLDAGHQLREDIGKEAIGPGGAETEQKMDVGNTGVYSGQQEYDVTLNIVLMLQAELESRGYTVYLTRNNNAVNISYKERTDVASNLHADAFISIHNGWSDDPAVRGLGAVCQTSANSYVAELYTESQALCKQLLISATHATGSKKLDIREDDKVAAINWSKVPMALLELGYLSNENDDRLLTSVQYLTTLIDGLADGLDIYFTGSPKE